MRNRFKNLLLSLSALTIIPVAIACTTDFDVDDGDEDIIPTRTPAPADAKSVSSQSIDCPDGEYPWVGPDGKVVCGTPTAPESPGITYDPGMPSASEIPPDLDVECETADLPTATASASTNCMPDKPPLYKSVIEFYKFDIRVRVLGKVGEHSTTRVYRLRYDWDKATQAYKAPVEDARKNHANHWDKDDARLTLYKTLETERTPSGGKGWKAYSDAAGKYCPCVADDGHKTEDDSCYGFASLNPFEVENHVCHSDTQVQGRAFQRGGGLTVTMAYECGRGLVGSDAPNP